MFNPVPVHVRFMVDDVSLRRGVLRLIQFSVFSVIPPVLNTHIRPNTTHKKDNRASLVTIKNGSALVDNGGAIDFCVVLILLAENLLCWEPSVRSRSDEAYLCSLGWIIAHSF